MKLYELFNPRELPEPQITSSIYEVEGEVGGRLITFVCVRDVEDHDRWRLDFAEHLVDDVDEPFVSIKTGKGKEFEVFSFVSQAAKEFVERMKPRVIDIRSSKAESGRKSLYLRMAKRLGGGFAITQDETSVYDIIIMTRISK